MARTFCPGPCCCLSGDQSIRRAQPRRLLRRRGNLLHRRFVVGVIYRTKPWRRAPALLLRLIEPRATCTLLVHSSFLDPWVWWFFSRQTAVGKDVPSTSCTYLWETPPDAPTGTKRTGYCPTRDVSSPYDKNRPPQRRRFFTLRVTVWPTGGCADSGRSCGERNPVILCFLSWLTAAGKMNAADEGVVEYEVESP
jgi:hypothetical protein